jgi:putative mRNA 3-end processing factor
MTEVLVVTEAGLYCPAGGFHIDPWRPVARAVLTHGHADHARPGMGAYLATAAAAPVIRHRLGGIAIETLPYAVPLRIGQATLSFHPAGHVPGSAQVRVEVAGEVWVVSGDYKTVADGLSDPWEPVRAHVFVSECTFGLPVFRWPAAATLAADLNAWWAANAAAGRVTLLGAYALGKAQRLLRMLDPAIGPILTHGAIEATTAVLRAQGIALPPTRQVTAGIDARAAAGALVIAPPSALSGAWARRFGDAATGLASGWMALGGVRRRRGVERGFVVSDHADWDGLNAAIAATGAPRVLVTHGYTSSFRRWLESQGYAAGIVPTDYAGEGLDLPEPGAEAQIAAPPGSEGR